MKMAAPKSSAGRNLHIFGYMEEKDAILPNRKSFHEKISFFSDKTGNIWVEGASN